MKMLKQLNTLPELMLAFQDAPDEHARMGYLRPISDFAHADRPFETKKEVLAFFLTVGDHQNKKEPGYNDRVAYLAATIFAREVLPRVYETKFLRQLDTTLLGQLFHFYTDPRNFNSSNKNEQSNVERLMRSLINLLEDDELTSVRNDWASSPHELAMLIIEFKKSLTLSMVLTGVYDILVNWQKTKAIPVFVSALNKSALGHEFYLSHTPWWLCEDLALDIRHVAEVAFSDTIKLMRWLGQNGCHSYHDATDTRKNYLLWLLNEALSYYWPSKDQFTIRIGK